ncbi:hypothetical protein PQ459_04870 [Chryseobacterium sp. KACC 21268]|nr:hypothetical protein PQ459_04870 [Chryseobacterium sp. KACC 21268]
MQRDLSYLKEKFETNDTPGQTDFSDWMDSYWHKDESPQVVINAPSGIDNTTKDGKGYSQNGKNVLVNNGANNIIYTINSNAEENFIATYVKLGNGTITFAVGPGMIKTEVDGTSVLYGRIGSRAMICKNGNSVLIYIYNV